MTSNKEVQKQQIQIISELFPANHDMLKIISSNIDEIIFVFVLDAQIKLEFRIDFPVSHTLFFINF